MDLAAPELVGADRRGRLELHACVLGEVGAATEQSGDDVDHRIDDRGARLARRQLLARGPRRQLGLPPGQSALLDACIELRGEGCFRGGERGPTLLPCLAIGAAPGSGGAVVGEHVVGNEEVLGWKAEDGFHRGDLVGTECVAVGLGGVGVLRRRPTDMAAQYHEARARSLGDRGAHARLERFQIVGRLAELHDVPAVAREALLDVVGVGQLGRPVDRDVIVVVDGHQAAEAKVAR
jgi:hypothetical protein